MSKQSIAKAAADKRKAKAAAKESDNQSPESSDENQSPEPSVTKDEDVQENKIETVEELESAFPNLVSAVRDEVVAQINTCSLGQIKENMPDFYKRLALEVHAQGGANLNIPGFLLELQDPFASGALRTYEKVSGSSGLRLPCVLPYKSKHTKAALKSYIVRASGGGDVKRAELAKLAMEKTK